MEGKVFYSDAIFWIDLEKISSNPYQPRREFDDAKLRDLSESIREYGVLQPVVVTRKEQTKEDGGLVVTYELIAGERRVRASRLAGLTQIPAVIRTNEENDRAKLELAIIENLQREDLNAVDRALAFDRLAKEFNLKHSDIAQRVGKSREYVSNTLRLLLLPQEMQEALADGKISEGHTRPLLMLTDRPEEQVVLFKEIMEKKLTVRESEHIARRIAKERVRKKEYINPELIEIESELSRELGTRVHIQPKDKGGKVVIEFFSSDDLHSILKAVQKQELEASKEESEEEEVPSEPHDDRDQEEKDDDLYSVKHFSL